MALDLLIFGPPGAGKGTQATAIASRAGVPHIATGDMFRAHIVDVTPDSITVEASGTTDKLQALVKMLEPFGVREIVQSGMVALGRGAKSITTERVRAD